MSLYRRYQRTQRMMTSRSKCRPLKGSSTLSIPGHPLPREPPYPQLCRARGVCTRAPPRTSAWREDRAAVVKILEQSHRTRSSIRETSFGPDAGLQAIPKCFKDNRRHRTYAPHPERPVRPRQASHQPQSRTRHSECRSRSLTRMLAQSHSCGRIQSSHRSPHLWVWLLLRHSSIES